MVYVIYKLGFTFDLLLFRCKCSLQASSAGVTQEPVRNPESQDLPRLTELEPALEKGGWVILMHPGVWETLLYVTEILWSS